MKQTQTTAGETAKQTKALKPACGVVAVIGAMVACTMGNSIIMAGIGAAMLFVGAWRGGYMNETFNDIKSALREAKGPQTERRAA